MATKDPRAQLAAILEKHGELIEKLQALHTEMTILVHGGDGIGEKLKRVKAFWCETWQQRHGERFDFDSVKHSGWLKKKILSDGEARVTAKMYSCLMGDEPAALRARHPFGWFMAGYNTYRGIVAGDDNESASQARDLRGA